MALYGLPLQVGVLLALVPLVEAALKLLVADRIDFPQDGI
jgi:hypothetical protein